MIFETHLYRIHNKKTIDKEVQLIQFKREENFWVKEYGVFGIILDDVLIDNDLGDIFKKYVPDQMKLYKTKVIRRATNEVWENYSALELHNDLTLDDFQRPRTDFEGLKIFWYMGGTYVNNELKNIIEVEFKRVKELEFDNRIPIIVG